MRVEAPRRRDACSQECTKKTFSWPQAFCLGDASPDGRATSAPKNVGCVPVFLVLSLCIPPSNDRCSGISCVRWKVALWPFVKSPCHSPRSCVRKSLERAWGSRPPPLLWGGPSRWDRWKGGMAMDMADYQWTLSLEIFFSLRRAGRVKALMDSVFKSITASCGPVKNCSKIVAQSP